MVNRLNLMSGGSTNMIQRELLAGVATPDATKTHMPFRHDDLLNGVEQTLHRAGLKTLNEAHALSPDGLSYFGMLQMEDSKGEANDLALNGERGLIVGLRNNNGKRFPAGLVAGEGTFVCDNLMFYGEVKLARKHTRFIHRDLPNMIERAVGMIGGLRRSMEARIAAYKKYEISDERAHDLIIRAHDARVISTTRIPKVVKEWREPRHPEFKERTAYSLMNAFTEVCKAQNIMERPRQTNALAGLLDKECGLALSAN